MRSGKPSTARMNPLVCPGILSAALHLCVVFAALAISPATGGDVTDRVVWFSFIGSPGAEEEAVSPPPPTPPPEAAPRRAARQVTAPEDTETDEPEEEAPETAAGVMTVYSTVKIAARVTTPRPPPKPPAAKKEQPREPPPKTEPALAKPQVAGVRGEPEQLRVPAPQVTGEAASAMPHPAGIPATAGESPTARVEKTESPPGPAVPVAAAAPPAVVSPAPSPARPAVANLAEAAAKTTAPEAKKPPAAAPQAKPSPVAEKKVAAAPQSAPLPARPGDRRGDLRLRLSGKGAEKLEALALFRSYPLSRRNNPPRKRENTRPAPFRVVRPSPDVMEVVVDQTGEGVYEFFAAAPGGEAEIAVSLKIREETAAAKTKKIGVRRIGGRERLCLVLMPEGILWDDPDAFSGSIDDGESITRFNSDTGFSWREFR